jgi:hypothetical protein
LGYLKGSGSCPLRKSSTGNCAVRSRCTRAICAPCSKALATKSCPSTRSPGSATNMAPGITWRESIAASLIIREASGRLPSGLPVHLPIVTRCFTSLLVHLLPDIIRRKIHQYD